MNTIVSTSLISFLLLSIFLGIFGLFGSNWMMSIRHISQNLLLHLLHGQTVGAVVGEAQEIHRAPGDLLQIPRFHGQFDAAAVEIPLDIVGILPFDLHVRAEIPL